MEHGNEQNELPADDFRADLYGAYALLLSGENWCMRIARRYFLLARGDLRERLGQWVAREVDPGIARKTVHPVLENRRLRFRLARTVLQRLNDWVFMRLLPLRWKLLGLMGIEHFKVMMAEMALEDPRYLESTDRSMGGLLQRHFVEVVEHRGVVHDVAIFVGFGYVARVLTGWIAMFAYTASLSLLTGWLSFQQGRMFWPPTYVQAFRFLFIDEKFLIHLVRYGLGYLRPGFHPVARPTSAPIAISPA
ncbi:MAG: metal-dependent hydrolase [Myxococcota bacterium]